MRFRRGFTGMLGAVLLAAGLSQAEQTDYAIGKLGAAELRLGLGPRPVAMGEAFVGKADDLNATAWNPAGLAQVKGIQAGFMHSIYLQETSLEYLAYAQRLSPSSGLGINLAYLNYGKIEKTTESNEWVGEFTPTTFALAAGYGQGILKSMAVGGAIKIISQTIDTATFSAFAVDAGALYRPGVKGLLVGLALQNLGTPMGEAMLPMNLKAGASYAMPWKISAQDRWCSLLDVNLPFGDVHYFSVNLGTEYVYHQIVAARLGYKIKDTGDLGGLTGLTAGAGFKLSLFNVDYALASYGDLGLTHQFALTLNFGAPSKAAAKKPAASEEQ